jgi:hypothetical protein
MPITWHAKNHHLIATRGIASVSVEVPIDGYFTDAREWLRWFRACILRAEAKLGDVVEVPDELA